MGRGRFAGPGRSRACRTVALMVSWSVGTLSATLYWQTHSARRPFCHIQAAALALAHGSKML